MAVPHGIKYWSCCIITLHHWIQSIAELLLRVGLILWSTSVWGGYQDTIFSIIMLGVKHESVFTSQLTGSWGNSEGFALPWSGMNVNSKAMLVLDWESFTVKIISWLRPNCRNLTREYKHLRGGDQWVSPRVRQHLLRWRSDRRLLLTATALQAVIPPDESLRHSSIL